MIFLKLVYIINTAYYCKNMRFLLTIITILILSSCISNKNTSYRVVNKNGKVVYFERKKPLLNNNIISNTQELTNIQNINKKIKNTKEVEKINNDKIDDNLILGSSAYTLKSVVDNVVKEEDISYIAKQIDKNKKAKTIQDFTIPEYYFNDDVNKQRIDNRTKEEKIKQIELENKENEKEYGLFARIFGGNRNKVTENIVSKEDKEQIKKLESENQKNEQEYGLFARIFGGNRNKTVNDIEQKTEEKVENSSTTEENKEEELKIGNVIIDKNQQLGKSKNDKYLSKQNKSKTDNKNNINYKLASTSENNEENVLRNIKEYNKNETKAVNAEGKQEKQEIKKQKSGFFGGLFGKNDVMEENRENNNNTNKQDITSVKIDNTVNKQSTAQTVTQTVSETSNKSMQGTYLQTNKFYIQLGSFANEAKAKKLLSNFGDVGDGGRVVPVKIKDKFVYRSVIGTFNTKISAEREMEKVLNKGHFDCYVFKKK